MRLLIAIVAAFVCSPAIAADYLGKVLAVSDGDTFTMEADGAKVRVRICGIDAPERGQAGYGQAPPLRGLRPGRDRRGRTMEENMMSLTLAELMHLTRQELCALDQQIRSMLPELEAGTAVRTIALASLDNIRRVMVLRGLHF